MDYYLLADMTVQIGYELAVAGAETDRVEETMRRVIEAYGTEGQAFAIPNCVAVSFVTPNTKPLTIMKRVGYHGNDLERIEKLKEIARGWLNYFRMASLQGKLKEMDGWLRNRLRYCIWHHWKKPERKRKNLIRLGVEPEQAYQWSRSRMGGWRIAQSPILVTTITLERLRKRGYESLLLYYEKVALRLNEPPCTRPVRTVV